MQEELVKLNLVLPSFNNKTPFRNNLDVKLRKKLVKCYIWSTETYCAERWTLLKMEQKYLNILVCGALEGWRSVGTMV
jgi:hypothetical protein